MERKIGEIFEYKGEWYQCLKSASCDECAFLNNNCIDNPSLKCSVDDRTDNCSVIFKKLEKVGEPFERNGYMYQEYKAHTYPLLMSGGAKIPTDNGFAVIIQQNKEDMEENKLNLKPFDLEAAKAGKPVCTRDGRKARIICFDAKCNLPIIALITQSGGDESLARYHSNGRFTNINESDCDLMMLPEKKEGYVNLYHNCNNKYAAYIGNNVIYKDREYAEDMAKGSIHYIKTVKVEWEE